MTASSKALGGAVPPMTEIIVGCYPTAKSLPLLAGQRTGIFARHGIAPSLQFHDNSRRQRDGLARGAFHLIHMAVDNAVSMVEDDGLDVVVLLGGDSGMNEFFVQPGIGGFADLRGRRLVVDAVDTAYALQAVEILAGQGLAAGVDYRLDPVGRGALRLEAMLADPGAAGAILNPPYSMQARAAGLRSLGQTAALLGGYQASGAFALRIWAEAHRPHLRRYLAAYLESLRWVRDPANRDQDLAILCGELGLSAAVAEETLAALLDPDTGFAIDAAIDPAGFDKMLELRRRQSGPPARRAATTAGMVDQSYYRDALHLLAQGGEPA